MLKCKIVYCTHYLHVFLLFQNKFRIIIKFVVKINSGAKATFLKGTLAKIATIFRENAKERIIRIMEIIRFSFYLNTTPITFWTFCHPLGDLF